jgi:hypothetical protein
VRDFDGPPSILVVTAGPAAEDRIADAVLAAEPYRRGDVVVVWFERETTGTDLFVPMVVMGSGMGSMMMMALNTHLLSGTWLGG